MQKLSYTRRRRDERHVDGEYGTKKRNGGQTTV
jgi:hypothetical protein